MSRDSQHFRVPLIFQERVKLRMWNLLIKQQILDTKTYQLTKVCKSDWVTYPKQQKIIFARDSIYAKRAYAIAIPSVCPSVCPSVTRVIHAKTVVARMVQFSPYSSPIPLVFARWVSSRNSKGLPLNGGVKQGLGRKNSQFPVNNSPYLRNGAR